MTTDNNHKEQTMTQETMTQVRSRQDVLAFMQQSLCENQSAAIGRAANADAVRLVADECEPYCWALELADTESGWDERDRNWRQSVFHVYGDLHPMGDGVPVMDLDDERMNELVQEWGDQW